MNRRHSHSVTYTALNIRAHPHSEAIYVLLIEKVFRLRKLVKLRGDSYGIMTELRPISDNPAEGLVGKLGKFTKIQIDGKWFNLEKLRAAEEDETQKIQIPVELQPNFTTFNFVFYPVNHYLIIECKDKFGSISPKIIENYFQALFNSEEIVKEFNIIELTLVPREDQLQAIFSINVLTHLELIIRKPNSDGLAELEKEVEERLINQQLAEEKIILKAQPGKSINPDQKTQNLCNIAQYNGEVKGTGSDTEGKRVEKSTKQHPLTEVGQYLDTKTTQIDFLFIMAEKIISKIKTIIFTETVFSLEPVTVQEDRNKPEESAGETH